MEEPLTTTSGGSAPRVSFERAGDYVLVLERDASGRLIIVDATEEGLEIHGYAREELIGQPLSLIDPDFEMIASGQAALRSAHPVVFVATHRRKDGSILDVEVRAAIVTVGGRERIVCIERDMERVRASEARLRHMHDLMQYVIGHARSAIAVHDRDLKYVYVSERYLKDYNVTERDVIGRHHYDVFPDLPQKWRDVHQRALQGEVSRAEEDVFERADGSVEWTRWECRPWYEPNGSIGGIIIYTEVITEKKRAEEEKKLLEAQLQQAMKMEAVGRLAGGIPHDFNNLLTAIIGNVSVLIMDARPGDPGTEVLLETANAAERAAILTRQLLAFSRKQLIEPRPIDLNDLIGNLEKMLTRLIGEDIRLQTVLADDLPAVNVDVGQFEQVLVNLVVNGRDAMPSGGTIIVETQCVELDEVYCEGHPYSHPGQHVMLAITDTGHGMSAEVKRHLFEPFFTTKGAGRGTGLGLASTFGAVKQAGGSIEVYSEVGLGTTVKIYLPALSTASAAVEVPSANLQLPTGNETVLVIEDDKQVRRLAVRVLTRLGYRVLSAEDGIDALAQVERGADKIDLLVTDVVMPTMNGRELARLIQSRFPVKVLFTSGYSENIIAHHGVLDADVNFIPKPYTPERLAKKVRNILDGVGQTSASPG